MHRVVRCLVFRPRDLAELDVYKKGHPVEKHRSPSGVTVVRQGRALQLGVWQEHTDMQMVQKRSVENSCSSWDTKKQWEPRERYCSGHRCHPALNSWPPSLGNGTHCRAARDHSPPILPNSSSSPSFPAGQVTCFHLWFYALQPCSTWKWRLLAQTITNLPWEAAVWGFISVTCI